MTNNFVFLPCRLWSGLYFNFQCFRSKILVPNIPTHVSSVYSNVEQFLSTRHHSAYKHLIHARYYTPWRSAHQSKRSECLKCFINFSSVHFAQRLLFSVPYEGKRASIISAPTCAQRRRDCQIFEDPLLHGERSVFSSIFKMRLGIILSVQIGRLETMPRCLSHSWSGAWLLAHNGKATTTKTRLKSFHCSLVFSFIFMVLFFLVRRKTWVYK